nr:MAG TPA: hypothetical protein [Caudoviricetes sp.]
MSYIEDIKNRRNEVRNNIAKGFGCEFVKAQDDELGEIEKAVYADTAQNRKLGRVGKEYHRGKGKKSSKSKVNETKRKYTKEDFGKWKSPLMNYKNINQVKRELSQISKIKSPTKEQKEKKIWLQGVVDNYVN